MKKFCPTILVLITILISAQAQNGDFIALKNTDTIIIDGNATDSVWSKAEWNQINYVWIPYNASVTSADFTGRFKAAWDSGRLYLLVEITDDSLYDGHTTPTDNYWNDDCVEVFLDEDHSGGIHQNNFNAFAYHVGIYYDVVDFGTSATDTFNSHVDVKFVKNEDIYTWELAIKVFDDSYKVGDNNPVTLTSGKILGFSLAYCDNDGSPERENFIGSRYQTEANANRSYIDASIFGTLTLQSDEIPDTNETSSVIHLYQNDNSFQIFPSVSNRYLSIKNVQKKEYSDILITIVDIKGALFKQQNTSFMELETKKIDLEYLPSGIYTIQIQFNDKIQSHRFEKIN